MPTPETGRSNRPLLLSPFSLGNLELRNRFVFQPHYTALGSGGRVSAGLVAYIEERAAGGTGLIILGGQAVHPRGCVSVNADRAWDPENVPRYRQMVDAVHRHGSAIITQLTHSGPDNLAVRPPLMWGPTQMPEPSSIFPTKAMEREEIEEVVRSFADTAALMMTAGFDGIEIKIAHDGLLRAFASPFLNRRTDAYGGDFEGRMRLSVEVVTAVRDIVGPDAPVGVRLCVNEFTDWGYDTSYGVQMGQHLVATGAVTYLNADAGSFSSFWTQIPPATYDEGSFRPLNQSLAAAVDVPVIAFGRIKHPEVAERILASGEAHLIGMARQLIADPATARKTEEGREDEIRYCIAGNDSCIFQVALEQPIRCDHNPAAGRELECSERHLGTTDRPRRIAVVGGGPAGMKVAETAARRGHQVTLFERSAQLGGQVLLADKQPYHGEFFDVVDHLERSIRKLGVEVYLGVEVNAEDLEGLEAELVVVATGSKPALSHVWAEDPGSGQEFGAGLDGFGNPVVRSIPADRMATVDQVLSGECQLSGTCVVVDGTGHWEGAGTAEFLANNGCDVWLVAQAHSVGYSLEKANQELFYRRAADKSMHLLADHRLASVEDDRVVLEHIYSGHQRLIEDVSWVVPAIGRRSDDRLYLEARRRGVPGVVAVGDCVAPRLVRDAIREAYDFARLL